MNATMTMPSPAVQRDIKAARRQWDMATAIQQAVTACQHPATQRLTAQLVAASAASDFDALHRACVDVENTIGIYAQGPDGSPRGSRPLTRDEDIRRCEASVVLAVCCDYADPRWPVLGQALRELAAAYAAPEKKIRPLAKRLADWDREAAAGL